MLHTTIKGKEIKNTTRNIQAKDSGRIARVASNF